MITKSWEGYGYMGGVCVWHALSFVSVCTRSGNYFKLFSTSVCCISGISGNSAESHVKTWGKWRRAPSYRLIRGGANSLTMSELLFKVIIIGDATVGKTSFVQRYVHSHPRREYKPTVGGKDNLCLHFPTNCQTCEMIRINWHITTETNHLFWHKSP